MNATDANGWMPIESAPKDGTGIHLTDGRSVFYGWFNQTSGWDRDFPWVIIESHSMEPVGCCDSEKDDRVQANRWNSKAPTHWQPLPKPELQP